MDSMPQIRLAFVLTKKDSADFDRDAVTERLCIKPSKESAPLLSKGKMKCSMDIDKLEKELSGITILPATAPPYQMLKHAYWSIELPRIKCWKLGEPLQQLEQMLLGKEAEVLYVCEDQNLSADLIIRVFAESNNMPELTIPSSSVSFWASMGVTIGFDFYLD